MKEAGPILPGDHVDVAFAEDEKLFATISAGANPVGRITACHFVMRLPADVRDQVLVQCGKEMDPVEVVACAKELLHNKTTEMPALAVTDGVHGDDARTSNPSVQSPCKTERIQNASRRNRDLFLPTSLGGRLNRQEDN